MSNSKKRSLLHNTGTNEAIFTNTKGISHGNSMLTVPKEKKFRSRACKMANTARWEYFCNL